MDKGKENQIERSTEFFVESEQERYYHFAQEVERNPQLKSEQVLEVELKCCGYGYFQESREILWKNFIFYLHELLDKCKNLTQLKITFNGFNTEGSKVTAIIKALNRLITRTPRKLKTLWVHTNHLTACSFNEASDMFSIISTYSDTSLKEISLVMNEWNFKDGAPNFKQLRQMHMKEIKNQLEYVRFTLQLSSWYNSEEKAYLFIQPIATTDVLGESILRKIQTRKGFTQNGGRGLLRSLIQKIQQKFAKERQLAQEKIASKVAKRKVTKAQSEQKTFELDQSQVDKSRLPQYEKIVEAAQQDYKKAEDKMHKIQDEISNLEEQIMEADGKLGSNVKELVWQERVDAFHSQQKEFFINLLDRMTVLQVFHIDMRNWHPSLQMAKLKKTLDTQVNKRSESMGIFNTHSSVLKFIMGKAGNKKSGKKEEEREQKDEEEKKEVEIKGLKTIYMM